MKRFKLPSVTDFIWCVYVFSRRAFKPVIVRILGSTVIVWLCLLRCQLSPPGEDTNYSATCRSPSGCWLFTQPVCSNPSPFPLTYPSASTTTGVWTLRQISWLLLRADTPRLKSGCRVYTLQIILAKQFTIICFIKMHSSCYSLVLSDWICDGNRH